MAGLAFSAVSTVMQMNETNNAAAAQEQMIQDGLAKDRAATARQYQEINEVAEDDSAQRHKEYLIEAARLKAIGGESGLSGATQDRIEQESQNNADTDMASLWVCIVRGVHLHRQGSQASVCHPLFLCSYAHPASTLSSPNWRLQPCPTSKRESSHIGAPSGRSIAAKRARPKASR